MGSTEVLFIRPVFTMPEIRSPKIKNRRDIPENPFSDSL